MELKYTGSSHLNAVSSNTVILGNLCLDTGQFTDAGFSHEIVVNTLIVNMEYIRRVQFVNKITDKNNVNNQSYLSQFYGKNRCDCWTGIPGIPYTYDTTHIVQFLSHNKVFSSPFIRVRQGHSVLKFLLPTYLPIFETT